MVHIALQEHLDGKHVEWMEHVSDEQYGGKVGGVALRAISYHHHAHRFADRGRRHQVMHNPRP